MSDDGSLLRAYQKQGSEAAFAELVGRHLNLVFCTALRHLGGNAHRAQDISQRVFSDLARKASQLMERKSLAGWLYLATRREVAELMRAEQRRQDRERVAHSMQTTSSPDEPDWLCLKPWLEAGLSELRELDRDVILLRYYESRPYADIGKTFDLKEDAVRRRCDRAVDRLRAILQKRGLVSAATALALALGDEAVTAAPAELAAAITKGAIAEAGATVSASLTSTLFNLMCTTKATLTVAAATLALLVASVFHHAAVLNDANAALETARARYSAERQAFETAKTQPAAAAPLPTRMDNRPATPRTKNEPFPVPPDLLRAYRNHEYAFWRKEYAAFFAERHLTAEQIEQFVRIINPSPALEVTRDEKGIVNFHMVSDTSHQEENMRAMLGPEGYQAYKTFERQQEAFQLAGTVSAMALQAGSAITAEQSRQLGATLAQHDQGSANRMAGTPRTYAWDDVANQAKSLLTPDQMAALDAVRQQTVYRIELANARYPELTVKKDGP